MCQAARVLRDVADLDPPPVGEVATRARRAHRRTTAGERFVLLGTAGGSNPKATRRGYSNAVVVGDAAYIVDCGEGVHGSAWRSGVAMHLERRPPGGATVRSIFLTHLHSDHVIDYANLILGLWPTHQIDVYGPGPAGLPIPVHPPDRVAPVLFPEEPTPGVAHMTELLFRAFAYNLNERMADEGRHDVTSCIKVHEIGVRRDGCEPDIDLGVVADGSSPSAAAPAMDPVEIQPTDAHGVRVTAVLVQHAPVFPALAYRFDTPSGSVVFSGDTGPCDNVVRLAQGADYLVHEVINLDFLARRIAKLANRESIISHLASSHTSPQDAARIAERAGVGTLVLSHLVPGDDEFGEDEWEAWARPHFSGEVVCGVDLDQFALSSSVPNGSGS